MDAEAMMPIAVVRIMPITVARMAWIVVAGTADCLVPPAIDRAAVTVVAGEVGDGIDGIAAMIVADESPGAVIRFGFGGSEGRQGDRRADDGEEFFHGGGRVVCGLSLGLGLVGWLVWLVQAGLSSRAYGQFDDIRAALFNPAS
jgi:hypothetical protein